MQEKFDLNKKSVPGEGYRKNLADKLRGVINESGFEEAQNELASEENKESRYKNEYEKEKIEQRAQWIISKYLSEPDLFRLDDSFSLKERQSKIDEILNKKIEEIKEKGGVSDEYEKDVYELVISIIKENDFETNPNLKHFKREHSDIILQEKKDGENKFIFITHQNSDLNRNLFFDIAVDSRQHKSATEENALGCMKYLSEKYPDEKSKIKYFTEKIFRGCLNNNVIMARPISPTRIFDQHYQLNDKFQREHKDYKEDVRNFDGYEIKDPSLIFGEEKKEEIENFVKGFIEIIENETDYSIAMEKLKNLPKPTGLKPTYSVLGGGVMGLKEDGKIWVSGNSERYGYLFGELDKKIGLRDTFNKDFTKEEINYMNL